MRNFIEIPKAAQEGIPVGGISGRIFEDFQKELLEKFRTLLEEL